MNEWTILYYMGPFLKRKNEDKKSPPFQIICSFADDRVTELMTPNSQFSVRDLGRGVRSAPFTSTVPLPYVAIYMFCMIAVQ